MGTCSVCGGAGTVTCRVCDGTGFCPMCDGICHHCGGSGTATCSACNGTGDDGLPDVEPDDDGD